MSTNIPYSYLNPDLGHHGPVVDGLLIARQIIEKHIPDHTWDTGDPEQDERAARQHNDYKDEVLAILNRRIDEARVHWARNS